MIERRFYSIEEAAEHLGISVADLQHGIVTAQVKAQTLARNFHVNGEEVDTSAKGRLYIAVSASEAAAILAGDNTAPFESKGWSKQAVQELASALNKTEEEIAFSEQYSRHIGRITRYGYPGEPLIISAEEVARLEQQKRENTEQEVASKTNKKLHLSEKASLLKIVRALALEAGLELERPDKCESIIQQIAASHGVTIPTGKGTISKQIKALADID